MVFLLPKLICSIKLLNCVTSDISWDVSVDYFDICNGDRYPRKIENAALTFCVGMLKHMKLLLLLLGRLMDWVLTKMDSNERTKEGSTFPKNIFSHVVSTCWLSFCTQSGLITCIRLVIYYTLLLLYIIRYTFIKLMLFVSAIIIFY